MATDFQQYLEHAGQQQPATGPGATLSQDQWLVASLLGYLSPAQTVRYLYERGWPIEKLKRMVSANESDYANLTGPLPPGERFYPGTEPGAGVVQQPTGVDQPAATPQKIASVSAGIPQVAGQPDITAAKPGTPSTEAEMKAAVEELLKAGQTVGARQLAAAWYTQNGYTAEVSNKRSGELIESYLTGAPGTGGDTRPPRPEGDEFSPERQRQEKIGRGSIFKHFLGKMVPGFGLAPEGVRDTLMQRFPALQATFELDPKFHMGREGKPGGMSFEQFLEGGNRALSPEEIQERLSSLASFNVETADQSKDFFNLGLVKRYRDSEEAARRSFDAFADPWLARIDPSMRGALGAAAEEMFGRMRVREPHKTFLQQMREMGGRFFNQ